MFGVSTSQVGVMPSPTQICSSFHGISGTVKRWAYWPMRPLPTKQENPNSKLSGPESGTNQLIPEQFAAETAEINSRNSICAFFRTKEMTAFLFMRKMRMWAVRRIK
jgi:hypothetical protein